MNLFELDRAIKHYITLNKDVIKLGAFSYYNIKNIYNLNK